MIDNIKPSFDRSLFQIEQDFCLDNILSGDTKDQKYDVIFFNTLAITSDPLMFSTDISLRNEDNTKLVDLTPRTRKLDKSIINTSAAALGSVIGVCVGAATDEMSYGIITAASVALLPELSTRTYDKGVKFKHKFFGEKKVDRIKGKKLFFNSEGLLDIDDHVTLLFGDFTYRIKDTFLYGLKEKQDAEIRAFSNDLKIRKQGLTDMIEANRIDVSSDLNIVQCQDMIKFYNRFEQVLSVKPQMFHLFSESEISSNYLKPSKSNRISRYTLIGNLCAKQRLGCKLSKNTLVDRICSVLQNKNYQMKNILQINTYPLIEMRRKHIRNKNEPNKSKQLSAVMELPFCVIDKNSNDRIYDLMQLNMGKQQFVDFIACDNQKVYTSDSA